MNDISDSIILIVDDNPKNLQLLGSILKEMEYKVEFATNGAEALEWLDEQVFDLVLLDIMMPGMDGYETCNRIRANRKLDDMPVIFLTAKTAKESIVKGFDAGAQDFISKPFDKSELLARVHTHIELRASKIKLNMVNDWLEEKVAERTKELEIANKQLSSLDEAKTEFLNLIGHEIRTPLNGIVGPMQLLKSESHDAELDLMLGLMEESVVRLEKFASQALLISNLRTGKYKFKSEKVDIKEIFTKMDKELATVFRKSNTQLVSQIDQPVFAIGEKVLLELCFQKLVENTLHFIRSEGKLVVQAMAIKGFAEILISDRRIVFSDDFLESMHKLFEPTGEYADSNLGVEMVLVNLILTAHNATISMTNMKDMGATLVIRVPQ